MASTLDRAIDRINEVIFVNNLPLTMIVVENDKWVGSDEAWQMVGNYLMDCANAQLDAYQKMKRLWGPMMTARDADTITMMRNRQFFISAADQAFANIK